MFRLSVSSQLILGYQKQQHPCPTPPTTMPKAEPDKVSPPSAPTGSEHDGRLTAECVGRLARSKFRASTSAIVTILRPGLGTPECLTSDLGRQWTGPRMTGNASPRTSDDEGGLVSDLGRRTAGEASSQTSDNGGGLAPPQTTGQASFRTSDDGGGLVLDLGRRALNMNSCLSMIMTYLVQLRTLGSSTNILLGSTKRETMQKSTQKRRLSF